MTPSFLARLLTGMSELEGDAVRQPGTNHNNLATEEPGTCHSESLSVSGKATPVEPVLACPSSVVHLSMPPSSTLFVLKRAYLATRHALETQLRSKGLTAAQFDVLKLLLLPNEDAPVPPGGLDQRAIQIDLGVTSATLTRLLAGMEGRGLISRSSNPLDSRGKRVNATIKAKRLVAKLMAEGEAAFYARVFNGFSEKETLALTHLLERMTKNLQPVSQEADHR